MLHFIALFCLKIVCVHSLSHCLHLDAKTTFSWQVLYGHGTVEIEVQAKMNRSALGWIGVGFSDYGEQAPSDMCILWMDYKGKAKMQDTWVDQKGIVHLDDKQDCQNFQMTRKRDGTLTFYFMRTFDSCDFHDYVIEDGTTHIVWMKGEGPLFSVEGLDIQSAKGSGFQRTTLLYHNLPAPNHTKDTFTLDIRSQGTTVSGEETTYWCTVMKLPDKLVKKHHVVQYEKIIEKDKGSLVHHMEIFHCATGVNEKIPLYDGPCHGPKRPEETRLCSQVVAAWAMGALPFIYPEKAGLPLGGPDYNPYVMLEVHYHNPELVSGTIDKSGFRLYLTPTLREHDAGIMELGLEYNDKMAIPPGQKSFFLRGFCISECTAVGLPQEGITVFGSQLHTHLTGVRVFTKHVRSGVELPELNRDNHYSQHLQEIRRLKHQVKIRPGDALVTTCEYQTIDRNNITLTGFSITDEMCVNYIHYYPKSNLEVCKSSIPDPDLDQYFRQMAKMEGQKTTESDGISARYKAIEWNPRRVADLQRFYDTSPLSMQCNQSSGQRFPGGWEGLPYTQIQLPLPHKHRQCGIYQKC